MVTCPSRVGPGLRLGGKLKREASKGKTGVVVNGVIVTATIPDEYIAHPGQYPVKLTIPSQGIEIPAGNFEVTGAE